MEFELPKEKNSIIKVVGVGGGGSNAVNHMFLQGIRGVDFIICNTDAQALDISPVPTKIQLGLNLTEGLGAGSLPEVGKNSAIETIEDIRKLLMNNTKMVFITAGMGGGTGTGAAPIIASVAKEMGILTVGIVTLPFAHEGKRRRQQAEEGIEQLKKNVDTLLVISNDKLREIYGNLKLTEAFVYADNVLTTAAKSIAEIITVTSHINVDFADIQTVMKESGVAIMGSATANGENRAVEAIEKALNSPLLNDNNIRGARYVLLNVVSGKDEITMDEFGEIMDYVQDAAGQTAEIIKGYGVDESLGDKVSVTIIATGFKTGMEGITATAAPAKKVMHLGDSLAAVPAPVEIVTEAPQASVVIDEAPEMKLIVREEQVASEPVQEIQETPVTSSIQDEMETESFILPTPSVQEDSYIIDKGEEVSMEFDITPSVKDELPSQPLEPYLKSSSPEPVVQNRVVSAPQQEISSEKSEQERRAIERISKLKALSAKLKTPSALAEMEREPAYKRREVKLENTPHSSESEISRFTLGTDEDKSTSIKQNNSFLHDNVD